MNVSIFFCRYQIYIQSVTMDTPTVAMKCLTKHAANATVAVYVGASATKVRMGSSFCKT